MKSLPLSRSIGTTSYFHLGLAPLSHRYFASPLFFESVSSSYYAHNYQRKWHILFLVLRSPHQNIDPIFTSSTIILYQIFLASLQWPTSRSSAMQKPFNAEGLDLTFLFDSNYSERTITEANNSAATSIAMPGFTTEQSLSLQRCFRSPSVKPLNQCLDP